ncbi:MAG: exodeoxyribonuclease VII small subunit [Candidatus Thermoplasmatota archaeon]|jgi:exodeoxyribonuclease VII small subunit|nr:exodeoxyribonuclease VII small subunit [Candidatus Thermoplasmatota archaeon]MDX9831185.1 exodeoxyribonuclease VII small subunit [Anaerolineae bacterium]
MSDDIEGLCFEDAFEALEAAVRQLEEGNLTLEQSIALYQRGMLLARRCSQALDEAELQVQQLAPPGGL